MPLIVSVPSAEILPTLEIVTPVEPNPPAKLVVATPPILRVVALVLKTVAVPVLVVVMSPSLTAMSPLVVMLPVVAATEKAEPAIALSPILIALTMSLSDASIPSVMTPTALILRPSAMVISESKFSSERSWAGDSLDPFATRLIETVLSAARSISKLESVAVSAKTKSISLLSVVVIEPPPV